MKEERGIDFSQTAPRWSWRAVMLAVLMTALLYVLLPMTEGLSKRPTADLSIREIETVRIPPPLQAPPPPEEVSELTAKEQTLPKPSLSQPPPDVVPLKLPVDLRPGISALKGVTRNSFQVEETGLVSGLATGVFEISDLDTAPHPLVRTNPIYPPQARFRKIEGYVRVEFVVNVEGKVQELQVLDSEPGDLFVSAVERAVRGWRFQPGKVNGKAVPSRVRQRIDFTLE